MLIFSSPEPQYMGRRPATTAPNNQTYRRPYPSKKSDVSDWVEIPRFNARYPGQSNVHEAQKLLDDMAFTLRIPKQEPVDFLMPPASRFFIFRLSYG